MIADEEFSDLMSRVRSGDQSAAAELVRLYEPEIRRAARLRLSDPELRRLVDSIDISQSVFVKFFKNLDSKSLDFQNPMQLLALLTRMASNRVIDEHRKRTTAKRGGDTDRVNIDLADFQQRSPGPKTAAITNEMMDLARSQMSPEELQILDRRSNGDSWDTISADLNQSAEALRKRLTRALDRVRNEMADPKSQ